MIAASCRFIRYFTRSKMRSNNFKRCRQISAIVILFLVATVFFQPLRNKVFNILMGLPGAWAELSTSRLIQLYFNEEPKFPVVSTPVSCIDIEGTMKLGQWEKFEAEMGHYPVYDDNYFNKIKSNLSYYGITEPEFDRIERQYPFKPSLTPKMQRELHLTFKVLIHALELFNVTYFLNGGAAIGAFRHHGLVPWDDDLDICLKVSDWLKAKQILKCIPGYDVYADNGLLYKFFYKKSDLWKGERFIRFPFIDIFFLNEDDEYTWATSWFKKHTVLFKKSEIYPLKKRPYGDIVAAVPRNMESLLVKIYDADYSCVSKDFNHMEKKVIYFYKMIPCYWLYGVYPFVKRSKIVINGKEATVESKMLGEKVLNQYIVYD